MIFSSLSLVALRIDIYTERFGAAHIFGIRNYRVS